MSSDGAGVLMFQISSTSRQPHRDAWSMEHLVNECSIPLGFSLDTSSFGTYTSALNLYLTFCNLHRLPVDPNPDMLSFYVVFHSTHIKPDLVNSYLSGICQQLESFYPEICQNHKSMLVSHTMASCMRWFGTPVKCKAPLSHANILLILDSMVSEPTHDQFLFTALILTSIHDALLRLGELTFPDKKIFTIIIKLLCAIQFLCDLINIRSSYLHIKCYDFLPFTYHPCSFFMTIMPLPHFPQQLRCAQYLMVATHIPHRFLIYATTLSSISITHSCTIVFSRPLIGTSSYYLNPLSKTKL